MRRELDGQFGPSSLFGPARGACRDGAFSRQSVRANESASKCLRSGSRSPGEGQGQKDKDMHRACGSAYMIYRMRQLGP